MRSSAAAGDRFGYRVAGGDVDGDGLPDLLIGAQEEPTTGTSAGACYAFLEPLSGTVSALTDANGTFYGHAAEDYMTCVALPGDMDGDGFGDLVMGSLGSDAGATNGGSVYLFWGGGP